MNLNFLPAPVAAAVRRILGISNTQHIVTQQAAQAAAIAKTSTEIKTAVNAEFEAVRAIVDAAYGRVHALVGTGAVGAAQESALRNALSLLASTSATVA